jgi:lactoylglutathione lyase
MARLMATSSSPDVSRFVTQPQQDATKDFVMQQTMVRVKDPLKSLEFYCDVLGFNLVMYREFPQWEFNVYFVAPVDPATIPEDEDGRWRLCMNTPGCIELTWNYGSEEADGKVAPILNP